MHSLPIIDVVLCTYNGEKYLNAFLDSLVKQQNVRIRLFVSDDASDDKTLEILNSYAGEFELFDCVVNYRRLGPKHNFIKTLTRTSSPLIAFADQDDIWDGQKLSKLANDFANEGITAVHSNLVTSNGKRYKPKSYDLETAFWRNRIPGCTLMISRDVASVLCTVNPSKIVMHDWAAIIIALAIGKISKVNQELVRYRLHGSNYFGFPTITTRFTRLMLQIFRFESAPNILAQTEELNRVLLLSGFKEHANIVDKIMALSHASIFQRVNFCFRYILTSAQKSSIFILIRVLTKNY